MSSDTTQKDIQNNIICKNDVNHKENNYNTTDKLFQIKNDSLLNEERDFKCSGINNESKLSNNRDVFEVNYSGGFHTKQATDKNHLDTKCNNILESKYNNINDGKYNNDNKYLGKYPNDKTHKYQNFDDPRLSNHPNFTSKPSDFSPFSLLVSPTSSTRFSLLVNKFLTPTSPSIHQPLNAHSYPFSAHFNAPYHYQKPQFYSHLPHQPLDTNSGLEGSGCRLIEYRGAQVSSYIVM